jgi:hypothetical protein
MIVLSAIPAESASNGGIAAIMAITGDLCAGHPGRRHPGASPQPTARAFLYTRGWHTACCPASGRVGGKGSAVLTGIVAAGVILMLAARFTLRSPFFQIHRESDAAGRESAAAAG